MVAQHCESSRPGSIPGEDWKCWQEFTMRSRFRGKYLEVEPLGISHLVFPKTGNHYTWRKGMKCNKNQLSLLLFFNVIAMIMVD